MNLDTITLIVTTLGGGVLSYLVWRAKTIDTKLSRTMSRDDIMELIDMKLEPIKVQHNDLDDRLDRLEVKIDRLIELLQKR